MTLQLPAPDPGLLRNSPLTLVVCQVRFEERASVADPVVILDIHKRLGGREGRYPVLEQLSGERVEVRVAAGMPVSTQQTPQSGWRITSEDRNWIVALLPGSVSLETKAYTGWRDDFEPRLHEILDAVSEVLKPALRVRVGLRYVDLLQRDGFVRPRDWQGRISDTVLGLALHPAVGEAVSAIQQQVDIDAGDGRKCVLRHGNIIGPADNRPGYILDWDVSDEAVQHFDLAALYGELREFNDLATSLFQQAITAQLLAELKGE